MSDDIVDEMMAEIKSNSEENVPTEQPEQPQPQEQEADEQSSGNEEESQQQQEEGTQEPFPKKAVNAISRRDKQINKLRAELEQLRSQIPQNNGQNAPQEQVKPNNDGEPNMDDYDTYAEYMNAVLDHKLNSVESRKQQEFAEQQRNMQVQQFRQAKHQEIEAKKQEYAKAIPDFAETMAYEADIFAQMPPHVVDVLYHASDIPLACYNLLKNGTAEQLLTANPYQAAYIVAQAEAMGVPKAQPVQSKAPPPPQKRVSGATSSGGNTSLLDKSPDEIMKWLDS